MGSGSVFTAPTTITPQAPVPNRHLDLVHAQDDHSLVRGSAPIPSLSHTGQGCWEDLIHFAGPAARPLGPLKPGYRAGPAIGTGTGNGLHLPVAATGDPRRLMADALAILVSELTPSSRDRLASAYLVRGAIGASRVWTLTPHISTGLRDQQRWAATVLLDCVAEQSARLASHYSPAERAAWRIGAERVTDGLEVAPGGGRRIA